MSLLVLFNFHPHGSGDGKRKEYPKLKLITQRHRLERKKVRELEVKRKLEIELEDVREQKKLAAEHEVDEFILHERMLNLQILEIYKEVLYIDARIMQILAEESDIAFIITVIESL